MAKQRKLLKALLIQIRIDDSVKKEELNSFAKYAQLPLECFSVCDVFAENLPTCEELLNYDCIFIGGASEASVLAPDKYHFVPHLIATIKILIEHKIPTFASCFGFQAAVLALNGKIIKDEADFEMGTYPMKLSDSAATDPLYKNIPDLFYAVSVHQEKATSLPQNCILLASTKDCIHSFKVTSAPFWAFQFHPELDKECLIQRLNTYKEKYTEDLEHFNQIILALHDTPHANNLVRNFIDSIL